MGQILSAMQEKYININSLKVSENLAKFIQRRTTRRSKYFT
jgi:pyruvate formate-lyase activating enzyme-like uncharacterized protein